ncbi:MAG: chorismate mutase, partial [Lachnospiraceae bacterium]|nr:chorismate mutase [Lachnospiraceae bacterium]
MDLTQLREQIDRIDRQIVALYEERIAVSTQVAKVKIASGKEVLDTQREKQKITTLKALAHGDYNAMAVEELFIAIMSMSRKVQYGLMPSAVSVINRFREVDTLPTLGSRIVFQGAPGAYSEAAATAYFGEGADCVAVKTFKDVMDTLQEGKADYGVLPIENTTAGSVDEIYELFAAYQVAIVAEQVIPISQCLLGNRGCQIEGIKTVFSHPQSLAQSARFLDEWGWQQVSMKNNAFAAGKVAQDQDTSQAAIAGEHAAKIYGLEVLKRGINDEGGNATRFVILHKEPIYRKDAGKISIYFEVAHESGSLYRMLSHFI